MTASNLNALFEKTRPHPLDSAVRLTDDLDSLALIRLRKVRAVICERKLPADIKGALSDIDISQWEQGCCELPMPDVKCSPEQVELGPYSQNYKPVPQAIRTDIAHIAEAFRMAACLDVFDTGMKGNFLIGWHFDKKPALSELIGKDCNKEIGTLIPHQDGRRGAIYLTPFKLVTSYSDHPDQGMVWYPGTPLDDFDSPPLLTYQFRHASDPESLMAQFDAEYNAQFMHPGDVVIFKTDMHGRHPEEILTHRSPLPGAKTTRIALLLSNMLTSRALI